LVVILQLQPGSADSLSQIVGSQEVPIVRPASDDFPERRVSPTDLSALAVVLEAPRRLALTRLALNEPGDGDTVVDITWSAISTGTERLLWSGTMPAFPGMGYPLVPGYESVGTIRHAGATSGRSVGDTVFVPGANCYGAVRGLFGGASQTIVVPGQRLVPCPGALADRGVLISLAATAYHAVYPTGSPGGVVPDLIVGHGVLGRLMARILLASEPEAPAPTIWEIDPVRSGGAEGYEVRHPDTDTRRDYRCICDVSGDATILDALVQKLAPGGEIVLAGFYDTLSFAFAPAFMREVRLRIAAQFLPRDLEAVMALVASGRLSLDGLVTHYASPADASAAYETAFADPSCLKMVLDWRRLS
jgi:bacteriochlorophyllide a dehydrogenase